MSYVTLADLEQRFGESEIAQLTHGRDLASIIADINAVIDGYLASRYPVPLPTVPPAIRAYACDLVRERLYADAAPEIVIKRGDDARRYLSQVARGDIMLGATPPAPQAASGIAWRAPSRVMDGDVV